MFKKFTSKVKSAVSTAKAAVMSRKAEGYVDSGVKILIAVVIGALLLAGLYLLWTDVIDPTAYGSIASLFFYKG